ncbi:MAG: hypothetical protein RIA69_12235, partial [Cyclobacteriaceae bacterium]
FSINAQVNLSDLEAYKDVEVKVEESFNPSFSLVMESNGYDKLLVGEKLAAFLEMNGFKIISNQPTSSADNTYTFRYNYEFITDKKRCGGTIIKFMNGQVIDPLSQKVVATFSFEQKRNKICTDDIAKVLAYKLKRGS